MTLQEIFDRAVIGLRKQGEPAYDGMCRYRAPQNDGRVLKCAIGQCIPDSDYDLSMEGATAGSGFVHPVLGLERDTALSFGNDLQRAHDQPAQDGLTGADWLREFLVGAAHVAGEYNLDPSAITRPLD